MKRDEAIQKLRTLIGGRNLHDLAAEYGVSVSGPSGKVNKGWAGHVFERHLGLPLNSSRSPNFGSWELKSVPLKRNKNGNLSIKETIAVTMIDPHNVCETDFQDSHLLAKLRKLVIVARIVGNTAKDPTVVHSVVKFNLQGELYTAVEKDYNEIRETIENRGFNALTGKMGVYIQPRTKGPGHGSVSRAFYARKQFLAKFIKL
ncbi:MAG: MvaI/BcnI family restriction endonuclease [Deltaproteobacteria bacterium]|nr:MvaI/BcnI family restriction endonuclease [Deltaproteobacteria bacterium]